MLVSEHQVGSLLAQAGVQVGTNRIVWYLHYVETCSWNVSVVLVKHAIIIR